jgi:hypothetical protein
MDLVSRSHLCRGKALFYDDYESIWLMTAPQTNVFEDLAEEAITTCRQSLLKAAQIFASRKKDAQLDSQLFLIRHLLILKEMTASVDIVSRSRAGISSGGVIGKV